MRNIRGAETSVEMTAHEPDETRKPPLPTQVNPGGGRGGVFLVSNPARGYPAARRELLNKPYVCLMDRNIRRVLGCPVDVPESDFGIVCDDRVVVL